MTLQSIKKLLFLMLLSGIAYAPLASSDRFTELSAAEENPTTMEIPEPSGGSYMLHQPSEGVDLGPHFGEEEGWSGSIAAIGTTFDGFNFDDNSTETGGWLFIPPDPIAAAGTDRVVAVVNVMIEARNKTGGLLWRDALKDFFTSLTPVNFLFDPKVIYDHYENRFLVVALERVHAGSNPNAGNTSRVLLAVSKTATPATATTADWYYRAINSEESIGGYDHWADYPGFEVDEEAVYVTAHMFAHTGGTTNYRVRLWILDKGAAGGFYGGGAAAVTKYDPYALAGFSGYEVTTMPALVYGANGIGPGIGTFLVGYNGYTSGGLGGNEAVFVIRVDDPLNVGAGIAFTQDWCDIGDIEDIGGTYGWPALPDAPQSGTATLIEVNDRRALDAIWRNDRLWLTTTINPNSGPDAGHTTAHWVRIDTSTFPGLTLDDQGDIGGEDIHASGEVTTFFPSIAVNNAGDAYFGFSASSANIYCGAYCAGRQAADAAGTVRPSETVRAGVDYYQRTFGTYPTDRNRWGDYSGISLDPTDDNIFWVFNEYAMARGSGTPPEDGRWGTAWGNFSFAVSIYVDPDAVCGGNTPCYDTLQAGIDAALTLATVNIAAGDYGEDIVLDEVKELILLGGWNAAFTETDSQSTMNSLTIEKGTIIPQNIILNPLIITPSIIWSNKHDLNGPTLLGSLRDPTSPYF